MQDDPFVATSDSRNKLNSFRYVAAPQQKMPTPAIAGDTSHVEPVLSQGKNGTTDNVPGDTVPDNDSENNQAGRIPDIKNCPHTPAHRIPLADLISNTEEALSKVPKSFTPDDHVYWDHRSSDTKEKGVSPLARRKKRCRSSSPTSSPLNPDANQNPPNSQSAKKVMRTPQHDVGADLWTKYVGKNNGNPVESVPKIQFSQLVSSSPQTPAPVGRSNRDANGLRRTNSCAVDWPTSNSKRRRLDNDQHLTNRIRDGFARSKSSILETGRSKSSKIGVLVERIQESLSKRSDDDNQGPSSSSPLPDRSEDIKDCPATPPKDVDAERNLETPSKSPSKTKCAPPPDPAANDAGREEMLFSSDFGDDIDNEFLDVVNTSNNGFIPPKEVDRDEVPMATEDCPGDQTVTHAAPEQVDSTGSYQEGEAHQTAQDIPMVNNAKELDDFDDVMFPGSMEEILAQCDNLDGTSAEQVNNALGRPKTSSQTPTNGGTQFGQPESYDLNGADDYGDDEFGDGGIDMDAIEQAMMHGIGSGSPPGTSSQHSKGSQGIKRYFILDLAENLYVNAKGRKQLEKVLFVQEERTQCKRAITLRDSWFETPCTKGSYIHLVGDFDSSGQCIVDNANNNLIILHPDNLLSATVVADSFTCSRRAVLQDRVKVTSEANKPQVYGHILHEIFQEGMKSNKWDLETLNGLIDGVLGKYVQSLYEINVGMEEAADHLKSRMPALKAWAESFLLARPSADSLMEDKNSTKAQMSINKLLEVEEHIWSPTYGLKGNVDATVQVAITDPNDERTLTVPLELKTGRNNTNESHRAQTALYCLLLSDRYDIDVTFGILYYLEVSKTIRIRAIQGELRQMIQQRNQLANYIHHRLEMPEMLKKPRICNQCYAKTTCFVYHKLVDDGDGDTSGMGKAFMDLVDHLTPAHQTFFRKWDGLLTMEEKDMMKFRKELWTMLSNEREGVGRCFGNVIIEPGSGTEDPDGPKINQFRYAFIKHNLSPGFSFSDSQISVGEPIVVSDEKGHFALANGYVVQISSRRITVAVDRRLHNARTKGPGFESDRNQNFTGIMEIIEDGAGKTSTVKPGKTESSMVYRIDKDEFSNGMATVRNNLLCIMEKNLFQARQLRELIVDGAAPSFQPPSKVPQLPDSAQSGLNVDQKGAIEKVMSANDYALVLGMPGTGKTTTIAQIIRAIVSQGKSVLLTSYTHTAVDNILLKIRDDNIRTLRIGAPAKIHPDVQRFADLASIPKTTIEELRDSYENSSVVATTCLGVNHSVFNHRAFDYCIVDEASQITLPVCLGPIRMAKTFILVGDHYQLPPLVQSKEASGGGLDVSLFKLLCDTHPSSVVNLEHQYRMCEDIMSLSNTLIYSGRLKCGTPEVASRSLSVPDIHALKQHHTNPLTSSSPSAAPCLGPNFGRCWLRDLVDPSTKACLVNTDNLQPQAIETAKGSRIVNNIEAVICAQLVEALVSVGISVREIGVVTLYRSQLALIRQHLRHRLPDLEMHTADRFQGRDKEIIIMSCVRSNPDRNVGDLLRDGRRVNVAFTRARTKMLVVGSRMTLSQGNELLGKFVGLMDGQGWCYDLPSTAVEGHVFEELDGGFTQQSPVEKKTVASSSPEKKNGRSPGKKKTRTPLSPVKNSQEIKGATRNPEKVGKMLDGRKIVEKRPVLGDIMRDVLE